MSDLKKCQQKCLTAMRSGKNICLMGEAGTGKTYVLNKYIDECRAEGKNVVMTATTGIAALKIDGVTMHNAFAIPIPAYGHYSFEITLSKIKSLMAADVIIVEEVSMCRNDVFEYFAMVIKRIMEERKAVGITKKLQVIVCGDFFQLPPIVKSDELNAFKRLALDPSGYCFTSPAWEEFKFKTVILDEIVRQNDTEFIDNLNLLRRGDVGCLDYFNQRVMSQEELDNFNGTMYICSTNAEAETINDRELAKIEGPRCIYKAIKTGFCGKDYSVDEYLVLKNGARVMFMANDIVHDKYRNGQLGVVKECKEDSVVVTLDTGVDIEVKRYRWPTNKISVTNGMTSKTEIGAYIQIPIKLAYATTMHKTQGQTYDSAIISPNSFADGQLYVAISRVKSIEGIAFTEELLPEYVKVNPLVIAFYDGEYSVPKTRVEKKKTLAATALKKHKEKKKKTKSKKATTKKKTTTKKTTTAKKATTKSSTDKKTTSTAKKTTSSKKSTTKTSTAKKPIVKKSTAKTTNSPTKKPTTKKSTSTTKKSSAKK